MRLFILKKKMDSQQSIDQWKKWYKHNKLVAELDQPLVTKSSREKMHNTTDAVQSLNQKTHFDKAKEYFLDTISQYSEELSGQQIFKAFYAAAQENLDYFDKEYKKAKQIVDCIKALSNDKN